MGKAITGTNRNDTIIQSRVGNNSALQIKSLGGNDQIKLDRTDDLGGDNRVDSGAGNDVVFNLFEGGNVIKLGGGNDTYVGTGFSLLNTADLVIGGGGQDRFFVSTLLSGYAGGKGDDFFTSHGFRNDFNGGAGRDTISYQFRHEASVSSVANSGVTIDLAAGRVATGSINEERLFSIENATGSLNNDVIGGTDGANTLLGLAGSDQIFGFGGKDVINGGLGQDLLAGGGGADRFVFSKSAHSTNAAPDHIADFSHGEGDLIDLRAVHATQFIGSAAFSGHAGDVRFSGGVVQVDIDGDGTSDMAIVMENVASMVAGDFLM